MSNHNIRDFRNARAKAQEQSAESSNRGFYACVIAIPILAVIAGLGYKPLMEMRGKNVAAVQQAAVDMDAKRRAENPLYALKQDLKNTDGLIDSSAPLRLGSSGGVPSARKRRRNEYSRRALNANEFLTRVDAKAAGFTALEMEVLKYDRATWAMTTCGHSDLRAFYSRQNKAKYEKLKSILDEAKAAKKAKRAAGQAKQAEKAEAHFNQMKSIETKGQALAFVASGGAGRHMEAIGGFGGMASMMGDMESREILMRRQRFNKTECMKVRTIIQSGSMTVKTNIRTKS